MDNSTCCIVLQCLEAGCELHKTWLSSFAKSAIKVFVLSMCPATVGYSGFACVRHSSLCTFKVGFLLQSSKATAQAKHSSTHSQCNDMMHDANLLGMLSKSQAGNARLVHSANAKIRRKRRRPNSTSTCRNTSTLTGRLTHTAHVLVVTPQTKNEP